MCDYHINPLKENLFLQLVAEEEFGDSQSMRRIHTITEFKDTGGHKARFLGVENYSLTTASKKYRYSTLTVARKLILATTGELVRGPFTSSPLRVCVFYKDACCWI